MHPVWLGSVDDCCGAHVREILHLSLVRPDASAIMSRQDESRGEEFATWVLSALR